MENLEQELSAHNILDLRDLKCPLPVLKTRKHLRDLPSGTRIHVQTTDPLATIDIPHFCTQDGHRLIHCETTKGGHTFLIEKA